MRKNARAKGKIVRRLGVNIYGNPKYDRLLEKKPHPPGAHGTSRRRPRLSDYGMQLIEKQKMRYNYGVSEHQFLNVFKKAKAMTGITGDNMLNLLERRLDNVIYRLNMAATRSQARQLVRHGHIFINGKKASIPSMLVEADDRISIRQKDGTKRLVKDQVEAGGRDLPPWLALDESALAGLVVREPAREDIPTVANEQLVVEFYSK